MLKVECESCKAPYQVDERRVPASGLKMRCPKCGHSFVVKNPALPDADLPAPKVQADLPAAKPVGRPAPPPARPAAIPAPPPAAAPPPATRAPSPAPSAEFGFGDIDLPAVASSADLPTARTPVGFAPPPGRVVAPSSPAFGEVDLPAVSSPNLPSPKASPGRRAPNDFSGLDLPSLSGGAGLPQVASVGLPATVNVGLPSPVTAGLPSPVTAGLPSPVTAGLPSPQSAGLPATANALPALAGSLPMAVPPGLPAPKAFGALDLPIASGAGLPSAPAELPTAGGAHAGDVSFGELDLPLEAPSAVGPDLGSVPPRWEGGAGAGGTGFGDVDFGGGSQPPTPMGPPPAVSGAYTEGAIPEGPGEAAIDAPGAPLSAPRPKPQPKAKSKAPRVIALVLALVVVGGGALQLTPVGAFGHVAITDLVRAGEYKRAGDAAAEAARRKTGADVYSEARAAVDALEAEHRRFPRARALTAHVALAEFSLELRFGAEAARNARARGWLSEIPPGDLHVAFLAAQAARDGAAGDLTKARRALLDAQQKAGSDPIREDIALALGEVELASKDSAAAKEAFGRAQTAHPSARAQFGIARAALLGGDYTGAEAAVTATLAASPNHPGARILRARLAWDTKHDDAVAAEDLGYVLEGAGKALASKGERSLAFATRGWVLLGRERAGEARQAFTEAVSLDGQNASALLGNAEILFADGRYTEAMTRFDEALKKDPKNVGAVIGAAKAKLALERVQDARTLLQAARTDFPKDARVALWLGKVLDAQGEKKPAEQSFQAAVALADPKSPDAILAYSGLAQLLAAQGRGDEASQTLELAKQKLPSTSALERALAEVSAAQGKYDEAVSHFESALAKDPSDLAARFRLGVTYRRMKKAELATAEFDKVLSADKEYPGLALERGLLFEESGDVAKALDQFKSALDKAPNDPDLQLRVGAAYVASNRVDDGLPLLKKVLDQRPNSAEANHFIGRAYLKKGGLEVVQALRYLQRAVELDPNRAEHHAYVAWAANDSSPAKFGLAKVEAEKALALDKLSADAYWQRGVAACGESAVDNGLKDIRRALELKPARYEAHASLAICLDQKNDLGGAMAEWQKAVLGDQSQVRPDWQYHLGKLELERGSKAEAAKHLAFATERGQGIQPRPAWLIDAEFQAAEAFHKTGRKPEAVQHFKAFLAIAAPAHPDRKDAIRVLRELGETVE